MDNFIYATSPTKYYGQCEHLYCDDILNHKCLKRFFTVFDPVSGEMFRMAFCNDYLRLTLKQNEHDRIEKSDVSDFILKTLNIPHFYYTKNNNDVFIKVCQSPFTYTYASLKTALLWFQSNGSPFLFDIIDNHIRQIVLKNESFKKHSSWCAKVKSLLIKLDWNRNDANQRNIILNDIILIILKSYLK